MNLGRITKTTLKSVGKWSNNHIAQILCAVGCVGMISAVGAGIKGTSKASKLIEERKAELEAEELSKKEIIKTTWKCYIPTGALLLLSGGCFIGATNVNERRKNALTAALTLTQTAYQEFKDAAKETLDEETMEKVEKKAREKSYENTHPQEQVVVVRQNEMLFFEPLTKRPFSSTVAKVNNAVNQLNKEMRDTTRVSYNDFCVAVGIHPVASCVGDELLWDIDRNGYIDIGFEPHLNEETGETITYLVFYNEPIYLNTRW